MAPSFCSLLASRWIGSMLLLLCLGMSNGQAQQFNRLRPCQSLSVEQAEVGPGRFLAYFQYLSGWDLEDGSFAAVHLRENEEPKFFQKDTTYLSLPWQDREVFWMGVGIPICLREHAGRLYLIVFDRDTDFGKIRFRYYEQNDGSLVEIAPEKFPKAIATQNLWLRKENGFRDGKPVNEIEIALKLDPTDGDFQSSLTAKIWLQLETGKPFYEMPQSIDEAFLKSYLAQYQVVGLTQIEKEEDTDSAIAICSKQIGMQPHDPTFYVLRAKEYFNKGDFDSSIADLTEAIRLRPGDAEFYHYRGLVYRKKGENAKAEKDESQVKRLAAPH